MKLVWKLSIPQIFIVACFGLITFIIINSSFVKLRGQYVRDVIDTRMQLIVNGIENSAQKAVNEASLFVSLPAVIEAYEIMLAGDLNDPYSPQSQTAREILRRELSAMLDSYHKITGAKLQLHFHQPNGYSLVRLWREKQTLISGEWTDVSDDISAFRPTVMDVNRSGNIAMGIEAGSGGFAIRGVVPVSVPGSYGKPDKMLGSAEVLQEFSPILDAAVDGKILISLYANYELLDYAVELRDRQKYPRTGNFIRVIETGNSTVDHMISEKLLSKGKDGAFFEDHVSRTLAVFPLMDYRGSQTGVIVLAMDTSGISALTGAASVILALMIGLMIAFPVFALFIQTRILITRPLKLINSIISDITADRVNLNNQAPDCQKDEIGDLARYLHVTLVKVKNLVINIKSAVIKLTETGNELVINMNENAAAANNIKSSIGKIQSRVVNQIAGVTQTRATMERLTDNIHKLNQFITNQSNDVSVVSSAIEQMVANIQSVTQTLVNNSGNGKTLKESSHAGRSGLNDAAADILEITRESEGLLEINSLMENIAGQTNLLSMNAAIEAAHAGEAGKGFAVVADEIRKLSEDSGRQSVTIRAVLKKIAGSINKITASAENVKEKFEAIDTGVVTFTEEEDNIRGAMVEQGAGGRQILESVSNVNEITGQVKNGSEEMLGAANEVIEESKNLEKMTQEIAAGMDSIASEIEQINVTISHVNDISCRTREGIDSLVKEVIRFFAE
ncbi:MAG: methyl-accepting chemotaxis protein [Treponema sp.]|nr:methyl-accepting chemotaxis protein [Treponema sp.]